MNSLSRVVCGVVEGTSSCELAWFPTYHKTRPPPPLPSPKGIYPCQFNVPLLGMRRLCADKISDFLKTIDKPPLRVQPPSTVVAECTKGWNSHLRNFSCSLPCEVLRIKLLPLFSPAEDKNNPQTPKAIAAYYRLPSCCCFIPLLLVFPG